MAASDVLCSYCNWLVYSTESMLTGRRWISHDPLASFLCKIGMYLRGTSQIVSVLSLVLIAVDRYFAIVFPLKTTIMDQERVRFTFLVLTWIIAGAFCCPGIRYTKVVQIGNDSFCRLFWNESAYTIFSFDCYCGTVLYSTCNDIFSLLSHFESTKTPTD